MMIWYILGAVGLVLLALVAVLLVRTWRFKPKPQPSVTVEEQVFDRDGATQALRQLIRCKTVSYHNPDLEDPAEFEKLEALLPTLYPHVFEVCTRIPLPDREILLRWKGREASEPTVLMAHYDVVPVTESGWEKPPFEGVLEDGVLWGRGTLDTKVTVNGVLFAAEHWIKQGFVPQHDVYIALSGNEENFGEGAIRAVEYFAAQGIEPSLVLDEGGAVVENVFPGVKEPCGMIGIAEKGMLNAIFRVKSNGGHASAPKPHTPIGVLSKACCAVEAHPFPSHITPPVEALFDTLGRRSTFLYRMIFANLWLFRPALDLLCRKTGGELNALMRTTVAFTRMKGSDAANVIPPKATMVANLRLNPEDSVESALQYLRKTVNDPQVEITAEECMEPSRISHKDGAAFDRVAAAVRATWDGCIVSPYLMVQCSDSRHYGAISDKVYRFSAMDLTSEERATIHGHNERIRVESIHRAVEFYIRLIGKS